MTTIFQPLKRQSDGRYDYTSGSGSTGPYPIGYCAGHGDGGDAARYHSDGHATAEEAIACYHDHLLDTSLRFRVDASAQKPCATCGEWTQGRALLFGDAFAREQALCAKHQTRDDMKAALAKSEPGWRPKP